MRLYQTTNSTTNCKTGLAVRFWQLGIELRPFFHKNTWMIYPIYGGLGASFGYWLQGVEDRQMRYLGETRDRLLERRKRRAEREGGLDAGSKSQKEEESSMATTRKSFPPPTEVLSGGEEKAAA